MQYIHIDIVYPMQMVEHLGRGNILDSLYHKLSLRREGLCFELNFQELAFVTFTYLSNMLDQSIYPMR